MSLSVSDDTEIEELLALRESIVNRLNATRSGVKRLHSNGSQESASSSRSSNSGSVESVTVPPAGSSDYKETKRAKLEKHVADGTDSKAETNTCTKVEFTTPSIDAGNVSTDENCLMNNETGLILPPPPCPPSIDNSQAEFIVTESGNALEEHVSEDVAEKNETNSKAPEARNKDNDMSLSDASENDIDELLEKPYEDGQPGKVPFPGEGEKKDKVVLAHRGTDYFDVLPEGWVEVTHTSGLPVYLHKATRVCTFSRPYFIGPGSVRHHNVPISAIPCLHQRRVLKEVDESAAKSAAALADAINASAAADGNVASTAESEKDIEAAKLMIARLQAPGAKVETAEDFKERQLDAEALHNYAQSVFRFKTIQVYRFNKWSTTRSFHRQKKLAEAERLGKLTPAIEVSTDRPTLPSSVKLITVPSLEANLKPQHKGFFLNPQGKSSVSILHEYVQKVLKSKIVYDFTETRSSSTPYGCSARLQMNLNSRVMNAASIKEKLMLLQEKQKREKQIEESGESLDADFVVLGSGCGNSKKAAKLDAARSALKILIPAIDFDNEGNAVNQKKEGEDPAKEKEDAVALFDMLPIEDSRIPDLSARAGQPSPYLLLQECLKRNSAYGNTEIKLKTTRVKHQKHQFDMNVGKHQVSVVCSNKREGKQKASQTMLKKLHPNLDTWGSLIRLYGHEAQQKQQEARRSRQSIIKLQGVKDKESGSYEPNTAILEKLRSEMMHLYEMRNPPENEKSAEILRGQLSVTHPPVDGVAMADISAKDSNLCVEGAAAVRIDL
ncbi:hypothetical protein AB6A40_004574 [Gnathostoma spinigerum]|uniref:Pasha n=1 Tax=Gnathostoma spinigerum TaxID=75299 RepID=A0ABD6ENL1_9BILA